jgi:quaternary ammonium compound-resistance protein SugE
LIIGGLFEVGFASCLAEAKETSGLSTYWMLGFLICLTLSMLLLYKATQELPIGTAYAWTGIGAVGTVWSGIVVFKEPFALENLLLTTLIASIIGLKFVSSN